MSRNGVWYFNYRIPSSIRNRYNVKKRFIRKSLRTKKIREAVRRSREYWYLIMDDNDHKMNNIDQMEQYMADHADKLAIGRKVVEEYENTMKYGDSAEQSEFWKIRSKYEYECFQCATVQLAKEEEQREQEKEAKIRKYAKIHADEWSKTVGDKTVTEKQVQETSITISELIKKFVQHKTRKNEWKERTLTLNTGRLSVISDFLEYAIDMKDPMVHLFTEDHSDNFQDKFWKYPKNCKKKHPDKTMKEVMSRIENRENLGNHISDRNYNEYAQLLMALFKWAETKKGKKYIKKGTNVFTDLKRTVRDAKKEPHFNNKEIGLFFGSKMFVEKEFDTRYAWRYWIPIIMLYHGMRLEEGCQLLLKNIYKSNGVWCFDIREERDNDGRIITTTKVDDRVVPLHPTVINIGLLRYVEYLKNNGEKKLFPSLSNIRVSDGAYKQAGASVSKWFNEDSHKESKYSYITKVGIDKKGRKLKLYSFRHTTETLLINHPDNLEHDKIDTLIGHKVQSIGRDKYGEYYEKTILAVVEKIQYPEAKLPWDINQRYRDIPFPWE